jgi:hypothetical protein
VSSRSETYVVPWSLALKSTDSTGFGVRSALKHVAPPLLLDRKCYVSCISYQHDGWFFIFFTPSVMFALNLESLVKSNNHFCKIKIKCCFSLHHIHSNPWYFKLKRFQNRFKLFFQLFALEAQLLPQ